MRGRYEIQYFKRSERGGYVRIDKFVCPGSPFDGEFDRIIVAGKDDISPVFGGEYNAKCSCCWLGFGHSLKYHEDQTKKDKA